MDPFKKIDLEWDSSVSLMMEAEKHRHHVYHATPKELVLEHNGLSVACKRVTTNRKTGFKVLSNERLAINAMDAVFIRKDPPVDLEYLYMNHLLETVENRVLVINSPRGIRDANEKLFCFHFKKWMPPSVVTSKAEEILRFQKKIKSDVILKPLNRKGGEGIFLLPQKSTRKTALIRRATKNGAETIVAQKFLKEGLTQGDKRILLWNGEILGAFGRVPRKGEFRANMTLGGRGKKVQVTIRERRLVKEMKPTLLRMELRLVGLDLIAGYLTEINVTSPAGITDIHHLYGTRLETKIIDWLERRLKR